VILEIVADGEVDPLIFLDHGATIAARVGDNFELVVWANTTYEA
jgi:hypothetical protein